MGLIKSEAVLLKRVPFRNTSLVTDILTAEGGRLTLIAKGARKVRSPFYGRLDYGQLLEVVCIDKPAAMGILTECRIKSIYAGMHAHARRLSCGLLFVRILREFLEERIVEKSLFRLCREFWQTLSDHEPRYAVPLYLHTVLQLLEQAGYRPVLDGCVLCGGPIKGRLLFDGVHGGVLCRLCRSQKKEKKNLELSPNSVSIIEFFQRADVARIPGSHWRNADWREIEGTILAFASAILKKDITCLQLGVYAETYV